MQSLFYGAEGLQGSGQRQHVGVLPPPISGHSPTAPPEKGGTLIKKLPMVNDVIEKIQKKRSRDMIVLSFVIGVV